MATVTVSYEKVLQFRANAQMYVRSHPKVNNKFTHALTKVISRTNEIEKKYQEKLNDLRIDLAATDDKGNLISKEINGQFGQTVTKYEFTPKNLKELNKRSRDLGKETVEVEPYICTSALPDDVNLALQEEFFPFVIDKINDEEPPEEQPATAEPVMKPA